MAVRGCSHDRFCRDIATRTGAILNDDGLSQPAGQPLAHEAGYHVDLSTGWEADDQAEWPDWIGLRPHDAEGGRQNDRTCSEPKKLTPYQLHRLAPVRVRFSPRLG